ncbi:grpE protein homolog 2, mitochondrial isoform X3 [Ricinus communis]|uniref:GrpE protein homolog n=1 Tax=Ricinus communis TaxID=3988 RepID=B9SYX8_RICCO|nr:grpE protein homolog 2, mitochondrial isoform X3 [Ricinus communis]EEF31174.1 Protein grpE, putative [Ricinus communis]|eukprot:XP_002531197.1 grpE protein homolog 2, mitochondrial isoform X2 [Ricinus communis]
MLISRVVLSRASRSVGRRSLLLLSPSQKQQLPIFSNQIESLVHVNSNQFVAGQVSLFHHSAFSSSPFQRFGFTSSASPEANEKEGSTAENNADSTNVEPETSNGDTKPSNETREPDSDTEGDLSMDDLVKLVAEKEELLKLKHKEIEKMQDKVLRTYAEMENVMERTKREAENSRKFAIQNFAKGLLDVADNLGRASSVVKDSYSKIDTSTDTAGAVPLLKTLLEGVEMTEKQLAEVFRKSGVEKYDPRDEPFDPHRHNAVFEVPDSSKPPGTVAVVLKAGYLLHDRVIRPAEVGVTKEVENDTASNN